ncbi:putative CmcJ-like methyltransferase [Eremomyces bilateralis CBS 781.70]|uniref:CmcJ-like methyltransferase n=1 Tax=Eremomyces bilateralis CBS 781.70 TaxID=1392243 RepID=A0A6G1FXN1_9PEZI|nr:putative CmcJ-like methyltransferase [Eremomyces bilateralis CBS 781.70]KAF1810426.1 putative CmcJ-like methyltransferase [Eremomyces bilateralis CBS 781.70]
MPGPTTVTAELDFLKKDIKHSTEKPYKLQYDPGPDLPRWNCENVSQSDIPVHDIRGHENEYTLEKNGFVVLKLESRLVPEDFYDEKKVKEVYYEEVKEVLKRERGAKRVEILEHGIRKRHEEFPISTGGDYQYLQPTSVIHIDFTPEAALESSANILKVPSSEYERVQCMNIWKPLRGPLTDWPLTVCDVQTLDVERDCVATDVVTRDGFTENYQIYYNPEHRWYYLNKQMPDELIAFRQTDTDERYTTGVPHAGFRNPMAVKGETPRESIEMRVFLYF